MPLRLLFLSLLVLCAPLHGQQTDPLWIQAQEQIQTTSRQVATALLTRTEILDSDGKNMTTIEEKSVQAGWKDNEPVYTVVSHQASNKDGPKNLAFDAGLGKHPAKGLKKGDKVQRQGDVDFNGRACVLFLVSGLEGKRRFEAKAWIEKATALPLRVEYTIDPSSMPFTKAASYAVTYARAANGAWMPREVLMDLTLSVLFKKFRTIVKQTFEAWGPRP